MLTKQQIANLYGEEFAEVCPQNLYDTVRKHFAPSTNLFEKLSATGYTGTPFQRVVKMLERVDYLENPIKYENHNNPNHNMEEAGKIAEKNGYKLVRIEDPYDFARFVGQNYEYRDYNCGSFGDQEFIAGERLEKSDIYFLMQDGYEEKNTTKDGYDLGYEDSIIMLSFDAKKGCVEKVMNRQGYDVYRPNKPIPNTQNLVLPSIEDAGVPGLSEIIDSLGYYVAPPVVDADISEFFVADSNGVLHTQKMPDVPLGRRQDVRMKPSDFVGDKRKVNLGKKVCYCENNVVVLPNGESLQLKDSRYKVDDGCVYDKVEDSYFFVDENGNMVERLKQKDFDGKQVVVEQSVKEVEQNGSAGNDVKLVPPSVEDEEEWEM